MTRTQQPQTDPSILAIVHRAGRSWRVLIASTRNRKPSILKATEIAGDRPHGLDACLDEHRVSRVIAVLPASSVICRTCTLPDVEAEQLEQALALQAEAHLLGNSPEHRLAVSVLPAAPGETSRSGIILAWPEAASVELPQTWRPMTFAPDIAGLAALLNGLRPADPLIWMDRRSGSIALAVTHANGAALRATHEQADSAEDWSQRVTLALAETAFGVGHTGPFVESLVESLKGSIAAIGADGVALLVPAELTEVAASRIEGLHANEEWWSHYGIAAGVLLAATGEMSALTSLQHAPQIRKESPFIKMGRILSRPQASVVAVIICLLILGLAPLGGAGVRLGVLKLLHPDVEEDRALVDRAEKQLAMYRALEDQSWSMTKLLSDIVCNTPQGIELDWIRLSHSDNSFSVTGQAINHDGRTATEIVQLMQQRLNESRLFGEIDVNWDLKGSSYGIYEFDVSAKILKPHRRQPYDYGGELDFENLTLAMRKAGMSAPERADREEADSPVEDPAPTTIADARSGTEPVPPPDAGGEDEPEEDEPDRTVSTRPGRDDWLGHGGGDDGRAGRRSEVDERGAGAVDPGAIPEVLTEEMISAMTLSELDVHLTEVAQARKRHRSSADKELQDRLRNEFKLLMARKTEMKRGS